MAKLTCKFPTIYNVSLTVLKHDLLDFNWYRAITQCTRTANVLMTKLGIKNSSKGYSNAEEQTLRSFRPLLLGHVYCGYGRPSQLLLSSCTPLLAC